MNRKLIFLGLLIFIATACSKDEYTQEEDGKVDLFLIDSFSKIGYSYQIDEKSVMIKGAPLIYYSDFISYDSAEFVFELSDRAIAAIKNLNHSVHGLAFAIKANKELIYTGYFWPGYSSASCDWITIDPFMTSIGKKVMVRMGYPGLYPGQVIQDKRNDKRIIEIFKEDNKLK